MERVDLFCWEVSHCAGQHRARCPAYRSKRNCWEVMGTPINSNNQGQCEHCPVILSRIARAIAEAIGQTGGTVSNR